MRTNPAHHRTAILCKQCYTYAVEIPDHLAHDLST